MALLPWCAQTRPAARCARVKVAATLCSHVAASFVGLLVSPVMPMGYLCVPALEDESEHLPWTLEVPDRLSSSHACWTTRVAR